jgi:hypothetical protein
VAVFLVNAVLVRGAAGQAILPNLPVNPTFVVSTVPANGDLNPYGVAFVPSNFPGGGPLVPGDVLVSNFNASSNSQGTGTTIVRITAGGQQSLFFQGKGNLGLTTALGVLSSGFVIVGSLPTTAPRAACTQEPSGEETGVGEGQLLILDRQANLVNALHSRQFLDGPWDLTVHESGQTAQVFVSNALSATVTRLDLVVDPGGHLAVANMTQIASGYVRRCDPNALVIGPTGVAYDADHDVLYVASTGDNAIYKVSNAGSAATDQGKGTVFVANEAHLHGPLGLIRAPNGDLITSQGDAVNPVSGQFSEIVEYDSSGHFVPPQLQVDPSAGAAFGLALEITATGFRFAAVDDATNVLDIWVVNNP